MISIKPECFGIGIDLCFGDYSEGVEQCDFCEWQDDCSSNADPCEYCNFAEECKGIDP